ncbi:LysR substrate-binding domain-containing protein [Hahella sp. NBU794]|uniref:LysR substrate-binding domain-containing protein n=1 Tax=Hahella sp. NBU794 TaxID=3422590 RepID=UPI003D6E4FF2
MSGLGARTFSTLIYFEACGRLLSFSEAARELYVTTGAVSQQIRKLEEQLGIKLFERRPSGIQLTAKGSELLTVTRQSIDAIRLTIDRLQTSPNDSSVRLTSTPSFVFKWLIPMLKEFNLSHPDIKIETYAEAALLKLGAASFDLAIDYSDGEYQNFDATLLVEEILLPVISPEYMKGANWRDPRIWDSVSLLHDAMPWPDSPRDAEWRYWLDRSGLPDAPSQQGHYFNRSDMAIAAADAGLGVALARGSLVKEELASGRLIAPLPATPSCCNYYLITPKGKAISHNASVLKDWLLSKA